MEEEGNKQLKLLTIRKAVVPGKWALSFIIFV